MPFNLSSIFGSLGRNAVGIDIGSSSIKVVELKKEGGKAVLKTYGEIALGPYIGKPSGMAVSLPNDKIAEAVRDVLKEAGISTKNSGVSIPFKSSLVSLIEMPLLPENKLDEMIPIEARKYIPVPISEVALDWWVIPKEKYDTDIKRKDKVDVLVVSIHNEILNNYNSIVRTNDLQASFFEIEMFSSARSVAVKNEFPVMIMDFGALGTKLYIVEHGVIRMSHIINRGAAAITENIAKTANIDFPEAEKVKKHLSTLKENDQKLVSDSISSTLEFVWNEIRNTVLEYEKRYGKKIHEAVAIGGGTALPGFVDVATKKISIKTSIGNAFAKVEIPPYLAETLHSTGSGFSVAVGVALRKLEEMH